MCRLAKGLWLLLILNTVLFLPPLDKGELWGAEIKTMEDVSETLLEKQIVEMAKGSQLSTENLQKALDKVVLLMEQSDPDKFSESLQSIVAARDSLNKARETSRSLSDYVASNRTYMNGRLSRFVPLADLDLKVEGPYYTAVGKFFDQCGNLLSYCVKHFTAISTGVQPERLEYEELYNTYLFGLADFNAQADSHIQLLNDWTKRHNDIKGYLPN